MLRKTIQVVFYFLIGPIFLCLALLVALFVRIQSKNIPNNPNLVWGPTPIINNIYWSRAMRLAGYHSVTFTNGYYDSINKREEWDILIQDKYKGLYNQIKFPIAFLESLFRYDVYFLSFSGFFLGNTPLWCFESLLLKLARKKVVIIPFGADVFVYRRIKSTQLVHGLLISYPDAARRQEAIAKRVDHWCKNADVVLPGIVGPDIGRWNTLLFSVLSLDLDKWLISERSSFANGFSDTVYISHAPNHRGLKGSEFIIQAVKALQDEGLKVELVLIEKLQNDDLKKLFVTKVDILVEQLIFTGHGLNGLEGMASGLPVICNLEDDDFLSSFRRWSYFSECPLVSASPENIVDVLRKLVTRPELRHQLGQAGRAYVEKYHGLDSAQYLFTEVIEYCYGHRESLINLYHPLLGDYPNRSPKIQHPLINNKIID